MKTSIKQVEKKHDKVKKQAYKLIEKLYDIINDMPQKGNTSNTCQKTNILCHIQELEYSINGVCIEDFILNN